MAYTDVAKPTSTTYTNIGFQGKQVYDQYDVIYDDPNCFYDSVNQSQYTNIAKPTTTTYTDVSKPT